MDSLKDILHTDFIKVYSRLPRDSYFAIAGEAKKTGIPFAGHVPYVISVTEAARAGQKSQEHLYGFLEAASDSTDYLMRVQEGTIKDSLMQNDKAYRRNFLFRTFNAARLRSVLLEIKQYDSWICPTLTVNHAIANLDDTSLLHDPRAQYIGRFIRGSWDARKDFRFKSLTPEIYIALKKEFEFSLQIVKAMQDAGNTQKISMVILRGKVFDRAGLDALLARAKKVAGPL